MWWNFLVKKIDCTWCVVFFKNFEVLLIALMLPALGGTNAKKSYSTHTKFCIVLSKTLLLQDIIPSTDETCRFRSYLERKVVPFTKQLSDIKTIRRYAPFNLQVLNKIFRSSTLNTLKSTSIPTHRLSLVGLNDLSVVKFIYFPFNYCSIHCESGGLPVIYYKRAVTTEGTRVLFPAPIY